MSLGCQPSNVLIGGRSRDEYSPKITEPVANNCFSIFTQANLRSNLLFIKFYCFCWRLVAIFLNLLLLLYSLVGEYEKCETSR